MKNILIVLMLLGFGIISSCKKAEPLKVYATIETDFRFINQDSAEVTPKTLEGKFYVTDFFFTTCPSICPKMKSQMLAVYDEFKDRDDLILLSHSIDTRHDSVTVLKDYADRLGVEAKDWLFVTGQKQDIFDMAKTYMITAYEDGNVPGGYMHSGHFILVDKKRQVRGYYDGTDPEDTKELIRDIKKLIDEQG